MGEPRVLVAPGSLDRGAWIELDPVEGRHVVTVLRRRPGEPLEALDGAGHVAGVRVAEIRRQRVTVTVETVTRCPAPSGPAVDVALAVLHTAAMDWAVQKATELGARALRPLVAARSQSAERTVVRRADHWRQVALQALKQCGRPWALELGTPATVDELVSDAPCGPVVAAADGVPVLDAGIPASDVTLVVGPEGGFDDREESLLREAGWPRIVLGPHTLRAETAAIAGVAVLGQLTASAERRSPVGPTV